MATTRKYAKPFLYALCSMIVLHSTAAVGSTYRVEPNGNDGNSGRSGSPWRTIQRAADALQPGDEVLVANGSYAGFQATRGGTADNPIVFKADGNSVVLYIENDQSRDVVGIEDHDYIVIDGFIVQGGSRAGIRVVESRGVLLRNNVCGPNGKWGIFSGFTPEIQIIDNICYGAGEQHGIYVSNSRVTDDNPIIRGNESYGNGRNGIQLNGDCFSGGDGVITGAIIEDNFVHDNNWKGFSLISITGSLIQNNVVCNNGVGNRGAGGIHLADEPGCEKPSNDNLVVNNTVVEPIIAGIRITDESANNVVFNNLTAARTVDRTIIDEVGGSTIDRATNLRFSTSDGLFVDAAKNDYHLRTGSPAIGAGTETFNGRSAPDTDFEGTPRPAGRAYDIGADEFDGGDASAKPRSGDIVLAAAAATVGTVPAMAASSPGQAEIIPTHPRLYFDSEVISTMRAKACYDANGNQIPGCTPSNDWTSMVGWFNQTAPYHVPISADYLIAYLITQDDVWAQRAIAAADAAIADGLGAERGDSYLHVHKHIKNVSVAYDWFYDRLTAGQRTTYINYLNQLMTEIWNPRTNPYHLWSGWALEYPGNNYYYNFLMAVAYAGLALYNENPSPPSMPYDGTVYTDIMEFLDAKLTTQMIPYLESYGRGGGWHEGVNYRLGSYMHMFEMFFVIRNAGGVDYFQQIDFPRESLYYQLYLLQPGFQFLYPGGDLARESTMSISGYDRVIMLFLADGLRGGIEGEYAQYFLENVFTEMPSGWKNIHGLEMTLSRNLPSRDFRELPTTYLAEGQDWVNSRSGWGPDDVCASFISTDRIWGHQHFDQNSFVVYKNGWQAADGATYSHSGIVQETSTHNVILVDGSGQRSGEGTGDVLKFKATNEYTYVVGDATDAYNSGAVRRLNVFQREFVHVLPDFVVVFDRITPVSAGSEIKYVLQSHENTPTIQGAMVTSSKDGGKMFHKTLLPQNPDLTVVAQNFGMSGAFSSYRVDIEPPSPVANHINLNVMYFGSSSESTMPAADLFPTDTDNMVGTKVSVHGTDVILLFSKDPAGAAPQGSVIYEVGRASEIRHFLMDLKSTTGYAVETVAEGDRLTVVVSEGGGMTTSEAGILRFTTGGHAPAVALSDE